MLFFASLQMFSAPLSRNANKMELHLYEVSRDLRTDFINVADHIDSIRATMFGKELESYEYIFKYTDAYIAYLKGNFDGAYNLSEDALEHFLYEQENEWASRCLMLIGYIADAKGLSSEAIGAYRHVALMTDDPCLLAAAYLNMTRSRKFLKLDCEETYLKGKYYAELSGSDYYCLGARLTWCWLNRDSIDVTEELLSLANEYHCKKYLFKEADAYKCLVFYHLKNQQYEKACYYAEKSIDAYNIERYPSKFQLSGVYFLKGEILLKKGDEKQAYKEFDTAIRINDEVGYKSNNYSIYRFLYLFKKEEGDYEQASVYLEKALYCYRSLSDTKLTYYAKLFSLFSKITLIDDEINEIKQHSVRRSVFLSLLLVIFFTIIILWLRSLKHYYEKKSKDLEFKNMKLKEEVGELVFRTNQNNIKRRYSQYQSDVEHKLEKQILQHKVLSDIKDKYAETVIRFDVELPMLSSSEKRYAAMIALRVPPKIIAELLNVTSGTVAQYRNRIRKKLGIVNTKDELETILNNVMKE